MMFGFFLSNYTLTNVGSNRVNLSIFCNDDQEHTRVMQALTKLQRGDDAASSSTANAV